MVKAESWFQSPERKPSPVPQRPGESLAEQVTLYLLGPGSAHEAGLEANGGLEGGPPRELLDFQRGEGNK